MKRVKKENLKHRRMFWLSKRYVIKVIDTDNGPVHAKTVEGMGTLNKKRFILQNIPKNALPLQNAVND